MAEMRAMMKGVNDRLALVGHLRNDRAAKASIAILRTEASRPMRLDAADDLKLDPGDVIEVTLPNDSLTNLDMSSLAAR